jgi:hypothetical protein
VPLPVDARLPEALAEGSLIVSGPVPAGVEVQPEVGPGAGGVAADGVGNDPASDHVPAAPALGSSSAGLPPPSSPSLIFNRAHRFERLQSSWASIVSVFGGELAMSNFLLFLVVFLFSPSCMSLTFLCFSD